MLVILPALAVDAAGVRLGQGGGFYDRFVETLPQGSVLIAAVFEDELYPAGDVPAEPWDAVANYAWTPEGLHQLGR
ncbi:5-formyltetrahydrofolate cyclo-ligase [Pseudoglutamicibacter albus]